VAPAGMVGRRLADATDAGGLHAAEAGVYSTCPAFVEECRESAKSESRSNHSK